MAAQVARLHQACRGVSAAVRLHGIQKNAAAHCRISTSFTNHKHSFSTTCSNFTPAVTQPAPFFKGTAVVSGEFKEINLDDFKGKYLVIFFYPLDLLSLLPSCLDQHSKKGQSHHPGNKSGETSLHCLYGNDILPKSGGLGHMNIPLLSDLTKQISRDYGVLLEKSGIALRGLFIIDTNSIIKHIGINDLPVGRSVEETLRLVKAFQFVETHGEVCPANWTPDSPTIKPSPEDAKEYFSKVNE
ncbi:thioredoxin-dependent peroxide reductase, mitochondrial isoform X2 [Heterodontus francisci]|uniref:thioredoxin-dependent peroxide reductase, mitochondrial isoform X2 n=1 Tax=Heterodontus francisci TaxID=7792 RepID=UPI00355BB131